MLSRLSLSFSSIRVWAELQACHAAELEDALGIVGLAEGDFDGVLAHFDAEVEAEEA